MNTMTNTNTNTNNGLNPSWMSGFDQDVGQPQVNTGPPPGTHDTVIKDVAALTKVTPKRLASPELSAPVPKDMRSNKLLPANTSTAFDSQGAMLNDFLLGLTKSLDVKLSTAFRNGCMTMDEIIDTVQKGLEYARDKQKMQTDIIQRVRKDAIREASEAAAASKVSSIWGWIAQAFTMLALVVSTVALLATGQVGLAIMSITALVLTVMDFVSSILQQQGGPDISLAGLVVMAMKADGHGSQVVEDVRKWLGLAIQICVALMSAVGSGFAATALKASTNAAAKLIPVLVTLMQGLTGIGSGVANIESAKQDKELAEIQTLEMLTKAFLDFLTAKSERYAEDLQGFREDLNTFLQQRQNLLSSEDALNKSISA